AKTSKSTRSEVVVEGVDDLMTHMARCCKPVPNDQIIGFITRGRGVTVHRSDCSKITHLKGDDLQRLIDVTWAEEGSSAFYPVDIRVVATDRKGLLRDISAILTNEEVDVLGVSTQSNRKLERANMRFTVEISSMRQLSRLIDKISQLPDVLSAHRDV
ncbi:MAG: GTP diphosphokinase, partial [Sedimenticola sp.]|nr:GTP diphosphokinase [Sedimenticola sp.]